MGQLDGRTALITGAGGGIGRAVALAYAAEGARVLAGDLNPEAVEATIAAIRAAGGTAEGAAFDVSDAAQVAGAVERAAALGDGTVHILVTIAGAISPAMLPKMTEEAFRRILDIHLTGTFLCSQAVLPHLPDDGTGRIITVTSAAGIVGTIGQVNYAAAKAGIIGLTKSMARELARRQITVNCLAPLAATPMTQNIRDNEKLAAATLARIPLQRWAQPEEIAPAFVFFAGDGASYITGQVLPVDGGTVI
jgi:3-oxoacyl-[acyl-carrier protein] reductase